MTLSLSPKDAGRFRQWYRGISDQHLAEGVKMNTACFADNVIDVLAQSCDSNGRQPQERKVMLHFDNPRIHYTAQVRDRTTLRELERIGHQPYSPDLALSDFFLFGDLERRLTEQPYEGPEDLFLK
jgi:hypothetical protein